MAGWEREISCNPNFFSTRYKEHEHGNTKHLIIGTNPRGKNYQDFFLCIGWAQRLHDIAWSRHKLRDGTTVLLSIALVLRPKPGYHLRPWFWGHIACILLPGCCYVYTLSLDLILTWSSFTLTSVNIIFITFHVPYCCPCARCGSPVFLSSLVFQSKPLMVHRTWTSTWPSPSPPTSKYSPTPTNAQLRDMSYYHHFASVNHNQELLNRKHTSLAWQSLVIITINSLVISTFDLFHKKSCQKLAPNVVSTKEQMC